MQCISSTYQCNLYSVYTVPVVLCNKLALLCNTWELVIALTGCVDIMTISFLSVPHSGC